MCFPKLLASLPHLEKNLKYGFIVVSYSCSSTRPPTLLVPAVCLSVLACLRMVPQHLQAPRNVAREGRASASAVGPMNCLLWKVRASPMACHLWKERDGMLRQVSHA